MKCIILTIAYNAEKTIERVIKSILAQTYTDWVFYIVDNGSDDATYEISRRYAETNKNIIVLREEKNDIWAVVKYIKQVLSEQGDADAMCTLDADDAYARDFLKTAVYAMETNGADMVVLGTKFLDADTEKVIGGNIVQRDIVVSKQNIDQYFTSIHWYLRQMWCKLYRVAVFRRYEIVAMKQLVYGGDTALVLQFLEHADKFAIISQCGYFYYVSRKSASYVFREDRFLSDQILYENTMHFLQEKVGHVGEKNKEFMLLVYYHAMMDTLKVTIRAEAPMKLKLNEVYHSLHNKITRELLASNHALIGDNEWKESLRREIVGWMFKDIHVYSEEDVVVVWNLLVELNREFSKIIPLQNLHWLMANGCDIVEMVALTQYKNAFNELWMRLENNKIPCHSCIFALGQALAAYLSFENEYILFAKMLIQSYFEEGQFDHACQELADWLLILPNDKDLLEMKQTYMLTEQTQ